MTLVDSHRLKDRLPPVHRAVSGADGRHWHLDVTDPGVLADVPLCQPMARVALDTHAGSWVVAADVDGDGQIELVSAQTAVPAGCVDHHFVSALSVQKLNGSVLWRWGDAGVGRRVLHHDVPCQVFDWDGDGRLEVVICDAHHIRALDGTTGQLKHAFPIPHNANDCITFARLSGGGRADVILKTRYMDVWAFTFEGEMLWHVHRPAGARTVHHPYVIDDLAGPGEPAVCVGYQMLDARGRPLWTVASDRVDLSIGHVDCCRVVRRADRLADWRIALTTCLSLSLMVVDGLGKTVWERTGRHYESIDVGPAEGVEGVCIVSDVDHRPWGQSPVCLFDERGEQLGEINTNYGRHHDMVRWDSECSLVALSEARALFDAQGRCVVRLATRSGDGRVRAIRRCQLSDREGLLVTTWEGSAAYIFAPPAGDKRTTRPLGTGANLTYY